MTERRPELAESTRPPTVAHDRRSCVARPPAFHSITQTPVLVLLTLRELLNVLNKEIPLFTAGFGVGLTTGLFA